MKFLLLKGFRTSEVLVNVDNILHCKRMIRGRGTSSEADFTRITFKQSGSDAESTVEVEATPEEILRMIVEGQV